MKFSTTAVFATAAFIGSVAAVDPALVPPFGHAAGVNPTGTGDCDGAILVGGKPIKVPCSCPPPLPQFLAALNANVAAGHAINNPGIAVTFPTSQSNGDKIARIQASLVTLQNLNGPGKGCPASATTLVAQQQALQKRDRTMMKKRNVDPNLVPQFGISPGVAPTGTGNCAGANGIPIPCSCPPDRGFFIDQLNRNVAAGHAVNNPGIVVGGFPTSQSRADKLARLNVATITLQNLFGPGKGCPQAATTFGQQVATA